MVEATFVARIGGDPKHRIVIDEKIWKYLGLQEGDYIEITIVKKEK